MQEELAMEWCKRLRSGTIPQRQGVLATADGKRCCLGVACDMAVEKGIAQIVVADENRLRDANGMTYTPVIYRRVGADDEGSSLLLPAEVMTWLDMKSASGLFDMPGLVEPIGLADLNDTLRLTFPQIADVIERFWPWL